MYLPPALRRYPPVGRRGAGFGFAQCDYLGGDVAEKIRIANQRTTVIAQIETAARINYLPGNYRLYTWTNGRAEGYDGNTRRHSGVGLSVDQKVTDDLTLFARYGHHTTGRVLFDRALTVGAELDGSDWGRGADSVGIAFGSLRTSKDYRADSLAIAGYEATGSERQFELYYRYRLNDAVELSPDLQWISHPGGDAGADSVKVAGVRAKLSF